MEEMKVGIVGSGTMGTGIAQVASTKGCDVWLMDSSEEALEAAEQSLIQILTRLVEKEKHTEDEAQAILGRIRYSISLDPLSKADMVIEAISEDLQAKQSIFQLLEAKVHSDCVLATNTSSLSVASIAAACERPQRVVGLHFFNPAPLLPLVEVVPGIRTAPQIIEKAKEIGDRWGKVTVIAKDTPGFIVNRVARPFYGEALRIYEEGIADCATIDWALREIGGFRMGPFELMDLIGNDVNLKVTETIFRAFFYDPRFRPSFTQQRMVEAGLLGRKSGCGYYDYRDGATKPEPNQDRALGEAVLSRVRAMLINEACDAVFMNIATVEDVDLAMTKGVNYPQGLLAWADELGVGQVLAEMEQLFHHYGEDRYRPNPLLRRKGKSEETFYG